MRAQKVQIWSTTVALVFAACAVASSEATFQRQIQRHFEKGTFERAAELLREAIAEQPDDASLHYQQARALAQLGKADEAGEALLRAVQAGYRDFATMRGDRALRGLHHHAAYRAIVAAADRASDELAERALEAWLERFDQSRYRVQRDEQRRLIYATALDDQANREMRLMLERQADHLIATLFDSPPEYDVLIAIPTPRDARQLFQKDNVGGSYVHRQRQLVARNTGGSLRHEFFHVLHYGHMERLNQSHRLWVQEGMAALYEDYELAGDGSITFLPNERNEIVRNRQRVNRLVPWESLFELSAERFMARATVLYPQARSMFEFVASEGKLAEWYKAYVEHFDEEPTGARAFERAFGMSLDDVERRWRLWISSQPEESGSRSTSDQPSRRPSLGIGTRRHSANDGVLVTQILPGSTASQGNLQVGDVVVAIDGRTTATLEELIQAVRRRAIGERIEVRVRRSESYSVLPMILRALGDGSD